MREGRTKLKAGRADAIREMRAFWPIVTDVAFDDIEDRMIERWLGDKDRVWILAITALRSLRQEVSRYQNVFDALYPLATLRYVTELTLRDKAIEILMTDPPPQRPLVRTIKPAPSKDSQNGTPTRDAQAANAPTPGATSDQAQEPARTHAHTGSPQTGRQERGAQGQAGQSGAVREA